MPESYPSGSATQARPIKGEWPGLSRASGSYCRQVRACSKRSADVVPGLIAIHYGRTKIISCRG
jgi:hypothetical protein